VPPGVIRGLISIYSHVFISRQDLVSSPPFTTLTMSPLPQQLSMEDALAQLVSTSKSDIGLDSIVKGAEESLKFIEPWSLAR
jgi:hypothetical protein